MVRVLLALGIASTDEGHHACEVPFVPFFRRLGARYPPALSKPSPLPPWDFFSRKRRNSPSVSFPQGRSVEKKLPWMVLSSQGRSMDMPGQGRGTQVRWEGMRWLLVVWLASLSLLTVRWIAFHGWWKEGESEDRWDDPVESNENGATRKPMHRKLGGNNEGDGKRNQGGLYSSARAKRKKEDGPAVAASITTSKRPLMFHRAWLSFRMHCMDCMELVDAWFGVDDGSSDEECEYMKRLAPEIQWIRKNSDEKGLPGSLNALLRVTEDYQYLVQIEDDFFYTKDQNFVRKSLQILQSDPAIGQVLFNQHYAETDTEWETRRMVGGRLISSSMGDLSHIEHVYVGPVGSAKWKEYFKDKPGTLGNVHWPHFSTRGGVWNLNVIRSLGKFESLDGSGVFEHAFAENYVRQGYKTAFLPGVHSIHMGELKTKSIPAFEVESMYQRHGLNHSLKFATSAYSLA